MGATGDAEQPRGPGGAERGGPELGDAGAAGQLVLTNPWNIMIKHRQVQRRGRRSQMTTSFTDPAISMDLLRAVLQPSINEEIQTVFNKYMKVRSQYAADPQDKHWLAEQHHMRATGGKMAYLLIEEDIRDLAASDDYRGCLDLKLEELKSFVLPSWMVEKMRKYMETLRTENEHRAVEAPLQT
ncbi:deoxynucleotidyltransferase terminal-interacting protein 1 [Monodon monoceros]|uniref:deoxynucleotidyltransferase terminal-interacting protein 1 n=1 Tax=Monodon monoceros TaxID=40151 RepID=UPI0010F94B91|nr:deoxynucleotidyltransferase terminal-interacting protein 1 [Monodon monoceros]